jgi:hypothetical protein
MGKTADTPSRFSLRGDAVRTLLARTAMVFLVALAVWKLEDDVATAPTPLSGGLFGGRFPPQGNAHPSVSVRALTVLLGLALESLVIRAAYRRSQK